MEMNYEAKLKSVQDAMLPQNLWNAKASKSKDKTDFNIRINCEGMTNLGNFDIPTC